MSQLLTIEVEIHVFPLQTEQFALAHTGRHGEQVEGVKTIDARGRE